MGLSEVSNILWRQRQLLELLLFKLEEEQLVLTAGRTRWITATTGWAFAQTSGGKDLQGEHLGNRLLRDAGLAWTEKEIRMTSDGTPWRPLVHGLDIARAIIAVLEAPKDAIHNQIFNVGDTGHNYRVRDIAEIVANVFPGCKVSFGPPSPDNRSYRVSFEKIRKHLPAFKCQWDARRGAEQLYSLFKRIDMPAEAFKHRTFTRLKQLEYLIRTQQIDDQFFWKE